MQCRALGICSAGLWAYSIQCRALGICSAELLAYAMKGTGIQCRALGILCKAPGIQCRAPGVQFNCAGPWAYTLQGSGHTQCSAMVYSAVLWAYSSVHRAYSAVLGHTDSA